MRSWNSTERKIENITKSSSQTTYCQMIKLKKKLNIKKIELLEGETKKKNSIKKWSKKINRVNPG